MIIIDRGNKPIDPKDAEGFETYTKHYIAGLEEGSEELVVEKT